MSKEQTPIEKLIEYIKSRGLTYGEKAVLDRWIEEDKAEREQYAQAKVLEALEIVKTLTDNNVSITSEHIDNLIRSKTKV